jgi:autotransporter translocation and assembly factor TamB
MASFVTQWVKKTMLASALALGLGSAATPAHAFLDSEKAWNDLLQFAVRQINAPGEFEIELGKVTKPEEGFALISSLKIRDSDGIWLDASGLLVDWNPTSLLRGRFVFDTLSADEINVLRAPIGRGDPPADEAQIAFAWPRPPVTMVVETMLIKRMVIAGGLLPQDIEARIEGRFSDQGDIQEATLGVKRLDRPGDTIDLGTRIDFDDMDISFSLEAAEAPGGLVAELSGLPETEALEITAAAAGNPTELPFTVYADIGQIGIAEGDGVAQWAQKIAVTFNGEVQPGDKTAGQWRRALGDAARLKLDAEQTDTGAYLLNSFQIDSDAFGFQGKGAVDPEANTIDVAFDWAAKDIDALNAVIEPAQIGAVNGTATAVGALNAPKVDVNAVVRNLTAGFGAVDAMDLKIDSQPQTDSTSQTQRFSFIAKADGLALNDAALQEALGATPSFSGDGAFYGSENRIAVETIKIEAKTVDLEGNADYDLTTSGLDAELTGAAQRIGPFMRAAGLPIDGAAELALKIKALTAESVERLFLNAQLSNLSSEDPNYASIIGETAVLEALLVESDPGVVNIERGFFESATLRTDAKGQFSVPADSVDLELEWNLKDASRIAPVIAPAKLGGARGNAILKGTLSEPKVDVAAVASDVDYDGYGATRAEITSSLQMRKDLRIPFSLVTGLQGFRAPDPTLAALVGDEAQINATGLFDTATSLVTLTDSAAAVAAGDFTLKGDVHLAKKTLDAAYTLKSRDLATLGEAAGVEMSGTIDAEGTAQGAFSEPLISTRADVRRLKLYGYAVDALDLDLMTEPANADGDVPFDLDLSATNPSLGDRDLDALIGSAPKVVGSGTFNPKKKRVSLTSFATQLNTIKATASGDVDVLNNTLDLNFDLDATDLSGLSGLIGTELTGAVSAKGRAGGTFFAPELDIELDGNRLRYDQYSVGSISGRVDVAQALVGFAPFDVDVVATDVDLGDPSLNALIGPRAAVTAKGAFNQLTKALRLDNARFDVAAAKGTASGSVDLTNQTVDMVYDVDVSKLQPIGDVAGLDLAGSVVAKGSAKGSFTAPQVDTTIKGRGMRYDAYKIDAIDGTIDIQQSATGFAPFDINVAANGIDLGDPALSDLIGGKATVKAKGGFNQSQQILRIDGADIVSAAATASANGTVDLGAQSLDLDFALDADSLARLKPILNTEIAGAVTATGSVAGPFSEPALNTKLNGKGLRYDKYQVSTIDGTVSFERKALGASPFDIDVKAGGLDLGDPSLNNALGSTATIAAKGDFDFASQALSLDTARVVTNAATIAASGDISLRDQTLDIAYDLDANDLSPFSAIAGNDLAGALSSKGRASGSFTAPQVNAALNGQSLRYGPYSIAQIDGRVDVAQRTNGPAPFDIDVRASGIDLGDPQLTNAIGGSATILAKGSFDQSAQVLRLDNADIVTRSARANASGFVDLKSQTLDVSYDVDAGELGAFAQIAGADIAGSLKANGRAVGPFVTPAVNTTLIGRSLRYGIYSVGAIDGRINVPQSTAGLAPFSIDVTASAISTGDPALDALIGDSALVRAGGQIDQNAQVLQLNNALVSTRTMNASAQGRIDLGNQQLDVTFNVDAADISPATGLVGKSVGGALKASGSARGAFTAPIVNLDAIGSGLYFDTYSVGQLNLDLTMDGNSGGVAPFTLAASAYAPRLGNPQIEALLGETVTVDARGTLDQGALMLRLDDATVRAAAGAARAAGIVDIPGKQLDVGYSAHIPALGALQPLIGQTISGDARVDGRILGGFDDPDTSGVFVGSGIVFQTYELSSVTARYDLQDLISGPRGSASVDGQTPFGPLTANAAFDLTGGSLRLDRLMVNGLGVNIDGQFQALPGGLYAGNATLEAADLGTLGQFVGQDIAGTANGTVTLDARDGRQNGVFDLNANSVRYAQLATIGNLDLKGSVSDALGRDPYVDAELFAASAVISGFPVQQVSATARGTLSALETSINGNGGETGSDKIQTTALLNLVNPPRSAQFYSIAASFKGVQIASASQFTLQEIPGGGVRATGLDLRVNDGEIVGEAEYAPTGIVANLRLRNVPLQLTQLAGIDLIQSGRLFGDLNIDTRGTPRGAFNFNANVLRLKGAQLDDPFDFTVNGTLDGQAMDVVAQINSALINQPLRAVARIPLIQSPGVPVPLPNMTAPFVASLDWEGDVAEFWAFVPAPNHVLSGPVVIRGRADGTLNAPRLEGGAVLSGGRYQNLEFGTLLDQINLTSNFTQDGRVVFDLNATDGVQGSVAARGSYIVADGTIDAGITLNQAALVRRDDATAVLSGEATAKSEGRDIAVRGAFRTEFVELRLIGGFGGSVIVVDAIPVGETAPRFDPPSESANAQRISLDVSLDFPQQVFVRGRGLDSEWGGNIRATGFASDPRINGIIERRRGWLDLLGRQFELAIGEVRFNGPLDPFIKVRLQRESNDITGWLDVVGPASDIELEFGSIPALPADEVLPRLLFGRSKQSLSGLEAAQLAAGVATLLSGKASALDNVRGALGVDVLRVEGGDGDGTSIATGKYLTENIFVGAKQNLETGGTSAFVEIEVFDNIELEGEFGADEAEASANWKLDY